MGITALLSWYQEDPAWLDRCIRSLEHAGIDRIIAIDGAYQLYPRARNRSGIAQHEAITRAAYHIGAGLTIHIPETPWHGNEIEKRSFMFALGDHISQPGDWHLIIDADEVITSTPPDLHDRLASTTFDVAQVTFSEPSHTGRRRAYPIPILFRAGLGIRCQTNHYTYITRDGRKLWGNATTDQLAPRIDLTAAFTVDHLTEHRHEDRRADAKRYYRDRDSLAIEQGECAFCTKKATLEVPHQWNPAPDGTGWVANWIATCEHHGKQQIRQARTFLQSQGIDPARAIMEHRVGPAPEAKRTRTTRIKQAA